MVFWLPTLAGRAAEEQAFPAWDGGEPAGWVVDSALLTEEPEIEELGGPHAEVLEAKLPIPEAVVEDVAASPEIPEEFLMAYFSERPKSLLTDPQGLLSNSEFGDCVSFLDYHASDSGIDMFVYIIGGGQDIPSAVREEEMIERFFSEGRPAAIVYYYLGAPQRTVVYLSPSITDAVSAAEQRRAIESSVMQALEKTRAADQLGRFLVQMSIRIYWMERLTPGNISAQEAVPNLSSPVIPNRKMVEPVKVQWLRELVEKWGVAVGMVLAVVVLCMGFGVWWRARARYFFPEFEVEERLGGAHAAGVGAVISFASAAVSPASQRDQVPDYLRRA